MNAAKTGLLMILLTCLLVLIGRVVGGVHGAVAMLVFAGAMNFLSLMFSDKIVLAMYRAQPVASRGEAPRLWDAVERQARRAGIPTPRVYIIPTETPNAFATGRSPRHAAVAATAGILRMLDDDELEGVIAHELAHVKHRDTLISTIVATIAGAVMMLASIGRFGLLFGGLGGDDDDNPLGAILGLIVLLIAPIAAVLVQMWISRTREFAADEGGARISGRPLALASALRKLEAGVRYAPMQANPSTAHMFIVNPLRGESLAKLFSTHPPTEERVARLHELAGRLA